MAKQLASIDSFSGGRLTVGIAPGGRSDDYTATATDFDGRGAAFDAQLAEFREVWAGADRGDAGAVGPAPVQQGGPPLLIGGMGAAAIRRSVEHGAGWIAGGGGLPIFLQGADRVRSAWGKAGKQGSPRLASLAYYALGPGRRIAGRELPARLLRVPRRLRGQRGGRRAHHRGRDPGDGPPVRRGRLRRADPVPLLRRSRPTAQADRRHPELSRRRSTASKSSTSPPGPAPCTGGRAAAARRCCCTASRTRLAALRCWTWCPPATRSGSPTGSSASGSGCGRSWPPRSRCPSS
ncbi:LLM class flavin-dependent oxidoreductase [Pseudonocardia sp.]|uniref:LLM class flavin-dependent oxidoreductase n=1 Tax=Pseudonocardia sp. TaxID=60912 RepID=UPI0039C8CDAF